MTNEPTKYCTINEKPLVEIGQHIRDKKRLEPTDFPGISVESIVQYGELFKSCYMTQSEEPIKSSEKLEEEDKKKLINVFQKLRSEEMNDEKKLEWSVNIVVGNSHVMKSLRPTINIQMPTSEGETFEFNVDSFAQYRLAIANAVRATIRHQ